MGDSGAQVGQDHVAPASGMCQGMASIERNDASGRDGGGDSGAQVGQDHVAAAGRRACDETKGGQAEAALLKRGEHGGLARITGQPHGIRQRRCTAARKPWRGMPDWHGHSVSNHSVSVSNHSVSKAGQEETCRKLANWHSMAAARAMTARRVGGGV